MEVDAFLSRARGRQHEGPERAVEGVADLWLPGTFVIAAAAAVAQREPAQQADRHLWAGGVEGLVDRGS